MWRFTMPIWKKRHLSSERDPVGLAVGPAHDDIVAIELRPVRRDVLAHRVRTARAMDAGRHVPGERPQPS
ncbi:hypothetical protein GCM10023152_09330 [Agromyces bauzanensis]|uniref:Uncharacterized protein n=1 Tax=Agromyces bauzanensis TaxID=1308924 RepID=A0A917USW2_9MICO|nr:hypothetical protein GCM10011372_22300 [Agromyces bauzanensis]